MELHEVTHPLKTKDAISRWAFHVSQHNSPGTHKLYRIVIRRLERFLPQETRDITREHFERFLANLNGLKPNSYNTYVTAVKVFGSWLEEHDLPNPTKKLKKKRVLNIARVLTEAEYRKVLSVCEPGERDVIQFLCNTGLRISEFLSLTAANISEDNQFLNIIGKGNKPRSVPLNDVCRDIISRHPDLKLSKNDERLYCLCHLLARLAGIKQFTPQTLRHTFATRMMRAGVPIFHVSKSLGHSSTLITEKIYVHFVQQDLAGITDILDE